MPVSFAVIRILLARHFRRRVQPPTDRAMRDHNQLLLSVGGGFLPPGDVADRKIPSPPGDDGPTAACPLREWPRTAIALCAHRQTEAYDGKSNKQKSAKQ